MTHVCDIADPGGIFRPWHSSAPLDNLSRNLIVHHTSTVVVQKLVPGLSSDSENFRLVELIFLGWKIITS
jgi:hypothetical protein